MQLISRSWNLFRGIAGLLLSIFERHNPEALLEVEKENLRVLISRFNEGLISHAALSERLMTQVARGETEQTQLTARIRALVSADQNEPAARYALQLKQVTVRLEEDRQQLEAAEETYENLIRTRDTAVAEAKANIEHVRRQIGDLKVKRATADLESMASAMINDLGAAGDSFNRLRDMVEEEREKASARVRVVTGTLAASDVALKEAEQHALATQALQEFLADQSEAETKVRAALPDLSTEPEPAGALRQDPDSEKH